MLHRSIGILLVLTFGIVHASEIKDFCHLGSVYQCQNITTSSACNAYTSCIPFWKQSMVQRLPTENFECQFCEILMTDLKAVLNSKATEDEIVAAVNQLCLKLPQQSSQQACQLMANLYLRTALDMLAKDIEPRVVCHTLHMCSGPAYVPKNLSEVMRLHFRQEHNALATITAEGSTALSANGPTDCQDCQRFWTDLRERVSGNSTTKQIEDLLDDRLCSQLPQQLRDFCHHAVEVAVTEALAMIHDEMDPKTDCIVLGFCSGDELAVLRASMDRLLLKYPAQQLPSKFADSRCDICKELVDRAKTLINEPASQQKIIAMLQDEFCSQLPAIRTECNHYLTMYVPVFIRALEKKTDTLQVCQALDACPKSLGSSDIFKKMLLLNRFRFGRPPTVKLGPIGREARIQSSRIEPLGSVVPTCEFCELVIGAIEKRLPTLRTEAIILSAMEEVCHAVPGEAGQRCRDFVSVYGARIAQLMLEFIAPRLICTTLQLCPFVGAVADASSGVEAIAFEKTTIFFQAVQRDDAFKAPVAVAAPVTAPQPPTKSNGLSCDLCKQVVQAADRYVKLNKTEEQVEQFLESYCKELPQKWLDECDAMVKQYTPIIIDALTTGADPEAVCEELDLCGSKQKKKQERLVGKNPCTWGPSYWCGTALKAHRCGATSHCQEKVWGGKVPQGKSATPVA